MNPLNEVASRMEATVASWIHSDFDRDELIADHTLLQIDVMKFAFVTPSSMWSCMDLTGLIGYVCVR